MPVRFCATLRCRVNCCSDHSGSKKVGLRTGTLWDKIKCSRVRTGIYCTKSSRPSAPARYSMCVNDFFRHWPGSCYSCYYWFARDVTMVKNKSISLLWEQNSIFTWILREKNSIVLAPNMAAWSRGCKPRIPDNLTCRNSLGQHLC